MLDGDVPVTSTLGCLREPRGKSFRPPGEPIADYSDGETEGRGDGETFDDADAFSLSPRPPFPRLLFIPQSASLSAKSRARQPFLLALPAFLLPLLLLSA